MKGWGYYWRSIYNFLANQLDANKNLKKASLIVRYHDLCTTPGTVIDEILEHLELKTKKFSSVKKYYIRNLHEPSYYTLNFSQKDINNILEITKSTAA